MDTVVRWQAAASVTSRVNEPERRLPVLETGAELESGGVYLDLAHPIRGPFRALVGQVAGSGNRYVAQRDVPCDVWCSLIKSAAVDASGDGHEGEGSKTDGAGRVLPWPVPLTAQPPDMAAP